jgi:hypothetical protein
VKPGTKAFLCAIVAASIALLLSACAGTARGTKSSIFEGYEDVELIDYSMSRADALVVIRYPAIIHADAEEPYFHAFSINAIGGEVPPANRTKKVTTRIAQSVIAKSNYYVMSLYRELQRELPPDTVLLSPHIVLWDRDRGVHSRPILASEQIPSVVTVDFNVYSYPDTSELMDSPPVTFGDLVTPLFVVHSDRWLKPPTNGLLLASDPLLQAAWALSEQQVEEEIRSRLVNAPIRHQRPLDFIEFLDRRAAGVAGIPTAAVGEARFGKGAVEQYPVEKIQMQGAMLENLSEEFSVDPFSESFVEGAAARVRQTLSTVDHDRATFFARQTALARFDPELAVAFLARSGGESVRARLQLAEALIEAERRFIAAQSASIYEGTYDGDYGSKMRQMIEGEYRLLENRRSAARKQNVTTAVAALALAGSLYGATASGAAGAAALQNFSGVLMLGSVWAMSSTLETRAESAKMSENFLALIAPALERQISVQMEWLESKERISALGFAEFRNKTLTLYQARIRSLESRYADNCVFSHPAFTVSGRWFGACREGLAEGRGYGVLMDDSGNSLEYLGTAASGQPSGTGGMIVRYAGEPGAFYFEGGFREGLPDGLVRIEEPGSRPRIREFRAGKEVGSGAAERWEALEF